MIIKPKSKRRYVLVPNELIGDPRLSLETRAMIILLLSKPPNWQIWRGPFSRELATLNQRKIGRKKYDRMFREGRAAGYMARSAKQIQHPDGSWGHFDYIVGMPKDVLAAVRRAGDGKYLWDCRHPHAPDSHTDKGTTEKSKTDKSKTENNYPPHRPLLTPEPSDHAELIRREAEVTDLNLSVTREHAVAKQTSDAKAKQAKELIRLLQELHGCSEAEATQMFASLPDADPPIDR